MLVKKAKIPVTMSAMENLTVKQKCALRGKAHKLKPVVIIGSSGLSENILTEIGHALYDHELIKVRLPSGPKESKMQIAAKICEHHTAHLIQTIGNIITLYKKSSKHE